MTTQDQLPVTEADIVERLRRVILYQGKSTTAFLCHEAADEIEALRAREAENAEHIQVLQNWQSAAMEHRTELKRKLDVAVKALERAQSDAQLAHDMLGNSGKEFRSAQEGFGIISERCCAFLASIRRETE